MNKSPRGLSNQPLQAIAAPVEFNDCHETIVSKVADFKVASIVLEKNSMVRNQQLLTALVGGITLLA
ncbi:MAG: hypothetical protein U0930_02240 [Pirellulales bacterium]